MTDIVKIKKNDVAYGVERMTAKALLDEFYSMTAGQSLVYFQGDLGSEIVRRHATGKRYKPLEQLRDTALGLQESGMGYLLQRKIDKGDYDYMVVKKSRNGVYRNGN